MRTFCFALFLSVSCSLFAQVSVTVENMPLRNALKKIEQVSNYKFFYNENLAELDQPVSLKVSNATIEQTLQKILAGKELTYKIEKDNVVVLLQKEPVNQKTKTITGKIVDEKGETIIGASVAVKGTTIGAITNIDGEYTLTNVPENAKITISFIGYKALEFKASDKALAQVTLKEDSEMLDEVVVVGYGTQKKVNLTGAVSTLKMDETLGDRPVTSVASALQGAIPGLQVSIGNPSPGADLDLNIRGTNSINGGSPLVLVDNMPMDINMVDPTDIETVNVLKDAAASAIYGARAAFGVILITTKQGRKGEKMKLNYSGKFAFTNAYNLPEAASPQQAVKALYDSGASSDPYFGCDIEKWLSLLNEYNMSPDSYPTGCYVDEKGTQYFLKRNNRVKDMMDKFGFQQNHNLSFSGSTDKTSYRVALGVLDEDGVLYSDKDSYRRYNMSAFVSSDVTKWLQVQADVKFADSKNTWVDGGVGYGIWGNAMTYASYFPLGGTYVDDVYVLYETPRTGIILSEPTTRKEQNMRMLGRGVLNLLPGLTITTEYSYMREAFDKRSYSKKFNVHTGNEVRPSVKNSKFEITKNSKVTHSLNVFANYSKDFGKHSFSLMGGYNQEDYSYEQSKMSKLDIINDELPSIGQATGELTGSDEYSQYATRSLFYRLNYSYDGKYLLETNGRYDGSSKFPKKTRFGFFPSMSIGWRLSEEPFMNWSKPYLSNAKLRFSFGSIGNQSIDPYAFVPGMDAYLSKWLVGNMLVTSLKSPDLVSTGFTWETVKTYNYGLDLGLFDQKLDVTFDYYVRNTMDMLAPGMELPSVLGASAPKENVADLQTKGWELIVNWRDKIGNVNYRIGFNLYDSRTHITKFDNEVGLIYDSNGNVVNRIGKEIGEIWGYETDRFYTVDDFDENGKIKPGIPVVEGVIPNPGDVLYIDKNGDGIINKGKNTTSDPGDMVVIGNDTKRFQYGINAGINYKNFDLSVLLQGVGKRDLWRSHDLVFPYYSEFSNIFTHQLDYWTPENVNAFYPRLYERATGNTSANRQKQTRYLLDGSYCRIKNITLSYLLPKNWYQKLYVDQVNVFFSGEDLWTFYKTPKGIDPDIDPDNTKSGWGYPNMRKISVGINITF